MPDPNSRVLLSVTGFNPQQWKQLLEPRRTVTLEPDGAEDPTIDYAVVWKQRPGILSRLPNLKAIFSIGAGVDHIFTDPSVPDVPVVRVVDRNLTQYMTEYVAWRVLDHHRLGRLYRSQQQRKVWQEPPQPPADAIAVGIMGLGELGRAAAAALLALGFKVNGWSRTGTRMDGVTSFGGQEGLDAFLHATDILVVLLPLTDATRGIITYDLLRKLRRKNPLGGAFLVNAGRGQLQRDADILRALEDGTLKEASLDVFETEPLPPESPLWTNPRLFITPHAAASSDPVHLVPVMLDKMDAIDRGEPVSYVVNRQAGY